MKRLATATTSLLLLVLAATGWSQSRFGLRESETIRRTLEFSSDGGTKTLELDNIQGSIRVTGYNGSNVEMVTEKGIRAESDERLQAAKKEVRLDITDKSSTIEIYVDSPATGAATARIVGEVARTGTIEVTTWPSNSRSESLATPRYACGP